MPIPILRCNAWDELKNANALCITTNGTVKKNGAVVMGRGIAKEARDRFPGIDGRLGQHVQHKGNIVGFIWENPTILSFPVKHNWWEKADLALIRASYLTVVALVRYENWTRVILPKPGCGNGQLRWEDVEQVLAPIYDKRIVIVDR